MAAEFLHLVLPLAIKPRLTVVNRGDIFVVILKTTYFFEEGGGEVPSLDGHVAQHPLLVGFL